MNIDNLYEQLNNLYYDIRDAHRCMDAAQYLSTTSFAKRGSKVKTDNANKIKKAKELLNQIGIYISDKDMPIVIEYYNKYFKDDYNAQPQFASTKVRSKYVKADMEDFFTIGNDVDLDDMSAEVERLRRADLFKGRVPKKIQDRTIENMDVYHMGLADAFEEACRELAPKGSELWKAWYYDDFRKFIPSAYLEEYLDFKKYPKKY